MPRNLFLPDIYRLPRLQLAFWVRVAGGLLIPPLLVNLLAGHIAHEAG